MEQFEQMTELERLRERFRKQYGSEARVFRAPGRVNLIGEHTDYNDGFVMPAAIGFSCWIAAAPRTDQRLVICAEDFAETHETELSALSNLQRRGTWVDYPLGVAGKFPGMLESRTFRIVFVRENHGAGGGLTENADRIVLYSGKQISTKP